MIICMLLNITDANSQTTHNAKTTMPKLNPVEIQKVTKQVHGFLKHGQTENAWLLLDTFLQWPYQDEELPLLRMRADFYKCKKDFVSEATTYQHILSLLPDDKATLRGRALSTLRMGAPHLAVKFAEQNPEVFSKDELLEFHQASAGRSIKWGVVEERSGLGQQRFQATDKALLKNDSVLNLHKNGQNSDSISGRYTEFDRIVALRDRVRMQEAINLYQNLKLRQIDIPAYALAAVADAYLYKREPKLATDLYLQALKLSKNDRDYPNREWQLNLFNAYIDSNEFDAARELIDKLVADIPPVLNKGLRGVELDNEFYEEARLNQAYARIYADQYDEGQSLLDKSLDSAPFSTGLRIAYGDLLQYREQPRAAQRQYASILVDDPSNSSAAAGIAETAIALDDSQTAQHHLATLTRFYPENLEVQRLKKIFDAYRQPLLTVTSGWGESPTGGGRRGTENWQVDSMLHSPLFNDNWRIFSHTFNAEAKFTDATGRRQRLAIGADYRSPTWRVSGEVNQDQTKFDDYGFSFNTTWIPNDHWLLDLEYESNSNNIPLQASAAGISMQSSKIGLNYIANESRSLDTSVSYSWLSDSNRRIEAGINWQERWLSGSVYKLDTILGVFASDNSLAGADYFNPRQDLSIDAQIRNEWTLWRDYRRNFKNGLILAQVITGKRDSHQA